MITQVKIVDQTTGETLVKKKFFSDEYVVGQYVEEYIGWPVVSYDVRELIEKACKQKNSKLEVFGNMRVAKIKFHEY